MAELAYAVDLKSTALPGLWVRVPPRLPSTGEIMEEPLFEVGDTVTWAFPIHMDLGHGLLHYDPNCIIGTVKARNKLHSSYVYKISWSHHKQHSCSFTESHLGEGLKKCSPNECTWKGGFICGVADAAKCEISVDFIRELYYQTYGDEDYFLLPMWIRKYMIRDFAKDFAGGW